MLCRSFAKTSRRSRQAALSLLEMMITLGIGSIVLMAVAQVSMFTSRSMVALGNYSDLDRASRNALDKMSRDIRQAQVLGYYSTNTLRFTNMDGSTFAYTWDPGTQLVRRITTRSGSTQTNVVLSGCNYFCFRIWLRNPTNQFWFPYSANNQPGLTKLVDVSWKCSRRVLAQYNTESVQTAKIVLRN